MKKDSKSPKPNKSEKTVQISTTINSGEETRPVIKKPVPKPIE